MTLKMKFKLLFSILFFLVSCTTSSKLYNKTPFNSSGFAYIYNDNDYENNLIKGKLDNTKLEISNSELKLNSLIKITNPKTKESMVLKNTKKIEYPDFYKIIITEKVAKKLNINAELPFVEISEIKKNKSFVAKKAKIFNEEKKLPSNAPVTSVEISNISKNKDFKNNQKKEEFFILIGSFSQKTVAEYLKNRIIKEIPNYNSKNLRIIKKSNTENNLLSGPYYTINLMKNDYILLKNLGFEELNIVY
tara:strand:- start:1098 stop:1841 length:744 start_codon:yes stop_codon:yes gene_type:complete